MEKPSSYQPSAEPVGEATYRVFRLNHDGGIDSAEIISAQDDDEVQKIAQAMANGHGIDLWERNRFLGSYPPLSAQG